MTRPRDRLIMTFVHQNLDNKLKNMIQRMDFDNGNLICRNAGCPGDWVLLTALSKTEAGALYNRVGLEGNTSFCNTQWVIRDGDLQTVNTVKTAQPRQANAMPADVPHRLREALDFRYSYPEATQTPSKQTATGLKGRGLDEEVAQDALDKETQVARSWRVPSFISKQRSGTFYGNAIHAAMQYIRYDSCNNIFQVEQEIQRLMQEHFLSQEQGAMVSRHQIAAFFLTEPGKQLRRGVEHIREFKFSILDDATNYGEGLAGEQVLLQGVVDCAMIEDDGITVLDFKTDYVTKETISNLVERYRIQVETYAQAMARIYQKPIKASYLYFFRMNRFEAV
jgi:ATP-dependent helicase/nuclease subunit A